MPKSNSILAVLQRTYWLLDKSERKKATLMFFIICLNSIIEILGLAVVIPTISLVIHPETIQANSTLKSTFDFLAPVGINTPSRFLIALCGLMIAAFLFKALFGLLVNLLQNRYAFSVAHRLSGQMWSYHFSQSLERMRGSDSGRILAEVNLWPIRFADTFMVGGMLITNEIAVLSLITMGLLIYNPLVVTCISIVIVSGALIIRASTKRKLATYSELLNRLEPRSNSIITNAFRGFLEVITFNAKDSVRESYLKSQKSIFRIQADTRVFNLIPAKLYEVLAVSGIAGAIIMAILLGSSSTGFVELLSFMAISAYRIMPSMSRVNSTVIQMRVQQYVLDTIERGAQNHASNLNRQVTTVENVEKVDLHVSQVTLSYEALESPILENLELTLSNNKIHAIVGPSGSGKSTLISALLGLHKPDQGTIQLKINGQSPITLGEGLTLQEWLIHVGYLSQQPYLFQGTIRDNLTLRVPGAQLNEKLVESLIQKLDLDECLGSRPLEFVINEGGSNLSGGQQQRLALLRALQRQKPVLILDEATSALDHELRDIVFDLLREQATEGCNVILVTHDIELARRCDEVLDLGKLSFAPPS